MFILGLTGGIACGKTTATNFFFKKGIEIVDADKISRKLQKMVSLLLMRFTQNMDQVF